MSGVADSLILIIDNSAGEYGMVTEAARQAAAGLASSLDEYRQMFEAADRAYIDKVGGAVADLLAELLAQASMEEWWRLVLTDVLQLSSYSVRFELGEHFLPEPADMADLWGGDDE